MPALMEPIRTVRGLGSTARDFATMVGHAAVVDGLRRARVADAPRSIPRTSFDPRELDTLVDPYQWLPKLHEYPLWVSERLNVWMISGYEDLRRAGLDHEALSSAEGIFLQAMTTKSMGTRDRPDHTRLRGVVAKPFTREALLALEPDIVRLTDEGIDRVLAGETRDLVDALCAPVPMSAIALLLGIPPERWREFRRWAEPLAEVFAPSSPVEVFWHATRAVPRLLGFRRLIGEEMKRRREQPREDVLGLVRRAQDAGEVDAIEAYNYSLIMLLAGQETTANLLGSTLAALAQRPELYARLRGDRSLLPGAIEEFLRWSSPVQWVTRWTREPYEVAGHPIPANARVMLPWMFGNRDPRRFAEPDRLDIDRDAKGHLGFGSGIHFCLGAHLARLEARAMLDRFLDRIERLELAGTVRYSKTISLHGPAHVPVRIMPAS